MLRFWLLEFAMAVVAFFAGYLIRRILGRFAHGPASIVWGALFGLAAMLGLSVLLMNLGADVNFISLNGDAWAAVKVGLVRFWDTGLVGGALGALVASISMIRFHSRNNPAGSQQRRS